MVGYPANARVLYRYRFSFRFKAFRRNEEVRVMTTTIAQNNCNQTLTTCATPGTTVPFESINEPGAYICNWSGHLLRVPEDGVAPGRSPMINIVGADPLFVTKITNNPYVTLTKARLLASNFDINVNF